jgi:CheY-like chemotaxis protein
MRDVRLQAAAPVVLIVDDDEDSLAMYAFGLLAMGFQPVMAASGEEAFARACEIQPAAIVVDVSLPGVSGLDLTRRLRNDARTKNTGIVVLTGHAPPSAEQQAGAAGCDRFIVKPCLPDALAYQLRDVLVHRHYHADAHGS